MRRSFALISVALVLGGCASDDTGGASQNSADAGSDVANDVQSPSDSGVDVVDSSSPDVSDAGHADSSDGGGQDTGADVDAGEPCSSDQSLCLDHETRRYCQGGVWHEESCASGSGCVLGKCEAGACSDECRLGEQDGGATCELLDMSTGTWISPNPANSLHDRARDYLTWLHRDGMPYGGVANAVYSDPPNYTKVVNYNGRGDSAIWTGTYLASEALRLKATGAPDARKSVVELVNTLHLWFNVSGQPGLLVRYVVPHGEHENMAAFQCDEPDTHCDVEYQGKKYDYFGHISRDQYQGVMLGYAIAYEALGEADDATRELIREDVAELIGELMKKRTVPVEVMYNGNALPRTDITLRFAVLDPSEMHNGAISIKLNGSDYNDSGASGFQEFIPDLYPLLKQLPLGGWAPNPFPRAGSAVMLASFFNIADVVLDGSPKYQQVHDDAVTFYETNDDEWGNMLNTWTTVMGMWAAGSKCGDHYYGNNITMEPMYNLGRLEKNPLTLSKIRTNVIEAKMWPAFEHTKNPFFSFITLSTDPKLPSAQQVATDAVVQLAQFPPAPRVMVGRDWRNSPKYMPHQDGCTDQVSHDTAIDVGDRVVSDFIWQRQPWGLYGPEHLAQTFPGIDYLVAYWMGRKLGFIQDDTPHACAAWHSP